MIISLFAQSSGIQGRENIRTRIQNAWKTIEDASIIGSLVQSILILLAVAAIAFAIWKIFRAITSGQGGNPGSQIVKEGLWPLAVAGLMIFPEFFVWVVGTIALLIATVIEAVVGLFVDDSDNIRDRDLDQAPTSDS